MSLYDFLFLGSRTSSTATTCGGGEAGQARGSLGSRQLGSNSMAERETAYICMLQEPQESQLAYDAQRVLPNLEHPIDVLDGHLFVALRAAAPSPAISQTRVSANKDSARATTRSPGQPATPPKPIRGGEAIPCGA